MPIFEENRIPMKASELIKRIEAEIAANGDHEIVIAANRHSYRDTQVITRGENLVLSLFDKIAD